MNAIAREVMTIDWRLFEVNGKNQKEKTEHEVLDLPSDNLRAVANSKATAIDISSTVRRRASVIHSLRPSSKPPRGFPNGPSQQTWCRSL